MLNAFSQHIPKETACTLSCTDASLSLQGTTLDDNIMFIFQHRTRPFPKETFLT